jgi:hypothetical protein
MAEGSSPFVNLKKLQNFIVLIVADIYNPTDAIYGAQLSALRIKYG